jgi:acetolactate synthase-1/2/3 large subunit
MIEAGTQRVYGLPGLGVTWTLPAFHARQNEIDIVLTRSEHIGAIMAQAAGLVTGRPGVLMAQAPFVGTLGGPGILEAYMAGTPMVVLTDTSDYDGFGQKGVYQGMTGEYGSGDIKAILSGMTKYCTYATEPQEAVYGLQMAYKHASLPRQGPAALIMKTSMIRQDVPPAPRARLHATEGHLAYTPARPDAAAVERLAGLLQSAERPVFIAGHGVGLSTAGAALEALAKGLGAAVATSYNAKGVVDETCEIAVGMLGTWGHRTANRAVAAADLVVMLGASMGPDYTKFDAPDMIRPDEQTLVQVDIDPRNAGWVYPVDLAITGDAADVVAALDGTTVDDARRRAHLAAIADLKQEAGYGVLPEYETAAGTVHSVDIVRALQGFLTEDDLLTLDAGTNRIWMTHGLRVAHRG